MPAWPMVRMALGGMILGTVVVVSLIVFLRRGDGETLITIAPAPSLEGGTVTVYVGGAVLRPGLYSLPRGERIEAALAAAGGLTAEADPEGLNRALRLRDEDQIIVPRKGEPTATPPRALAAVAPTPTHAPGGAGRATPSPTAGGPININAASAADLARLPGIGPKLAQAIIDYRTANGPFVGPAELAEVQGISDRMVAGWGELIVFGPPAHAEE